MPAAAPVFEVEDEANETANPLAEREGQPSDERGAAAAIAGAVVTRSDEGGAAATDAAHYARQVLDGGTWETRSSANHCSDCSA